MAVKELNEENFDATIQGNDCVIVDFWAPWCGPCRAFGPTFEKASEKHEDVVFAKVNIDDFPRLASDFNIRSIPSLMIFKREFAIFSQAGAQTETGLDQLIKDAKNVDINELRKQKEGE
jgi:thioredoxin 1